MMANNVQKARTKQEKVLLERTVHIIVCLMQTTVHIVPSLNKMATFICKMIFVSVQIYNCGQFTSVNSNAIDTKVLFFVSIKIHIKLYIIKKAVILGKYFISTN